MKPQSLRTRCELMLTGSAFAFIIFGKPPLGDCMGSASSSGGRKRPIGSALPPLLLALGGAGGT